MKKIALVISLICSLTLNAKEIKKTSAADYKQVIIQAPEASVILKGVENAPKDTLFIFDVGNVLLVHEDAALCGDNVKILKEWFLKGSTQVDEKEKLKHIAVIEQSAKYKLVDPLFHDIVKKAQSKGKAMVLSKYYLGPINDSLTFQEWRTISLKNAGFNFTNPFPRLKNWEDKEVKAVYANGVLCTSASLKGPILLSFLHAAKYNPTHIIFVDDRTHQCESVMAAAKELNISADCYCYTEVSNHIPPIDIKIAEMQFHTMLKKGKWLSDQEAKQLLEKPSQTTEPAAA